MVHVGLVAMLALAAVVAGCKKQEPAAPEDAPAAASSAPAATVLKPVDVAKIPEGPIGDAIRRGKLIVEKTFETLPEHVGNDLHCTSCHLDGGVVANAGPWVGLPGIFPEFRARSGRVDTLSRRINDCFERSMNGKALDPEGEDMAAILAYMSYISRDLPSGTAPPGRGFKRIDPPLKPDRQAGAEKYAKLCVACHGPEGKGVMADGKYAFPPLWGDRAFNIGAGMARLDPPPRSSAGTCRAARAARCPIRTPTTSPTT